MQRAVAACGRLVHTLIHHDIYQPGNGCYDGGHGRDYLTDDIEEFSRRLNARVRLYRKVLI
uniref:Uncharacterized protein n=1 Tax=Klebsiella pneumoniae subsp. pneumoniae TaxID=72407 RepID=A0A7T7GQV3_KLEPN|nr:hypothetical protein [Klebsiella pneumoniae subsp. pneumoniae]